VQPPTTIQPHFPKQTNIMKKTLLLSVILIGMLVTAKAQDVIILTNGDEIKAKVLEIDLSTVKYKKFENLNGPNYFIEKQKVFMIKYENGSKDVITDQTNNKAVAPENNSAKQVQSNNSLPDNSVAKPPTDIKTNNELKIRGGKVMLDDHKLRPYEVKNIMNTNYEALRHYKGGRTCNTFAWIFTLIGAADLGLGLAYTANGYDATRNFAVGGLEAGVGLIFALVSSSKIEKSVDIYNSGLKKLSSQLNLNVSPYSVRLCLKF